MISSLISFPWGSNTEMIRATQTGSRRSCDDLISFWDGLSNTVSVVGRGNRYKIPPTLQCISFGFLFWLDTKTNEGGLVITIYNMLSPSTHYWLAGMEVRYHIIQHLILGGQLAEARSPFDIFFINDIKMGHGNNNDEGHCIYC
mmetsp:Transcript_7584/g.13674  ORF Transcript_7584/g.13674 Transcript_7584/m.13674 type:complete len:144 (-) Transcript_7584:151-582(-)